MIKELENIENFKLWLESFPDNSIIGKVRQGDCCPIAKYLNDRNYPEVNVGNMRIGLGNPYVDDSRWETH